MAASVMDSSAIHDIAIIGGGINGCGIARDAAGRGWSVYLCEAGDLGAATSAASTKLIHGGLRYLEYREFRLVREALMEREVLWGIAPHIIWPLRFVLPHHAGLRPAWMLRLGLFLYDHLGGRKRLPPTRVLRLREDPAGKPLDPRFVRGYEYSDCWVEDSRLVVLNARDAADMGATIAPRTRCLSGARVNGVWHLSVRDERTGAVDEIRARTIVNAAGPWVADVLQSVLRANTPATVRAVQGSHIVVPRLYPEDHCYIFQNTDNRIFFVIPYERDFTLIGTTDRDYHGDPADVRASSEEIAYLCESASAYFVKPIRPEDVVWSYSGVRPLYDDGASAAQAATRDYVLELNAPTGDAAMLSVFGGKITTYRRLAEAVLAKLEPYLPSSSGRDKGWTGRSPLPGGDFAVDGFDREVLAIGNDFPFLGDVLARRLVRAYGTGARTLLGNATGMADLGQDFGAGLTEAEIRYLHAREFARTAEDVIWRRSKLGLRLGKSEIAEIDHFMRALAGVPESAS